MIAVGEAPGHRGADLSDHQFKKDMVVTVNRFAVRPTELYERVMEDGDVISLLPIYTGG